LYQILYPVVQGEHKFLQQIFADDRFLPTEYIRQSTELMNPFSRPIVDEEFFSGTNIKSNFLCCLGYGDPSKIFFRLPRFDFDEVCKIV